MWKQKLAVNEFSLYEDRMTLEEEYGLIKRTGFDGVFTFWKDAETERKKAKLIREAGLFYQSEHMLWNHLALLWEDDGASGEQAIQEHLDCLRSAVENGIPLVIMHVIIGMERHTPTALGIERFGRIVREAERLGVTIGFENTEGEIYLEKVMNAFRDSPAAGFCFDSGHELCYNRGQDMLSLYGEKLVGTHLNDNLGIRDFEGKITWHDDLHLLPFDGIADWEGIAKRLAMSKPTEYLTFELNLKSKPDRHENDAYFKLPPEEYLSEAFKRASRVAALLERERRER